MHGAAGLLPSAAESRRVQVGLAVAARSRQWHAAHLEPGSSPWSRLPQGLQAFPPPAAARRLRIAIFGYATRSRGLEALRAAAASPGVDMPWHPGVCWQATARAQKRPVPRVAFPFSPKVPSLHRVGAQMQIPATSAKRMTPNPPTKLGARHPLSRRGDRSPRCPIRNTA